MGILTPKIQHEHLKSTKEQLEAATRALKSGDESKVRGAVRDIEASIPPAMFFKLYTPLRDAIAAIPVTSEPREVRLLVGQVLGSYQQPVAKTQRSSERIRGKGNDRVFSIGADVLQSRSVDASNEEVAAYVDLLDLCVARCTDEHVLAATDPERKGKQDYGLIWGLQEVAVYFATVGGSRSKHCTRALAALDAVVGSLDVRKNTSFRGESDPRAATRARCAILMRTARGALDFLESHGGYYDTPEIASAYLSILENESRLLYESGMTYDQVAALAAKRVQWFLDERVEREQRGKHIEAQRKPPPPDYDRTVKSDSVESGEEPQMSFADLLAILRKEWDTHHGT